VSPAMSRADSILQTASIARWVSVAVTATNHTSFIFAGKGAKNALASSLGEARRIEARLTGDYAARWRTVG
jgi:hypothetical protein